jgi:hypothetical protein
MKQKENNMADDTTFLNAKDLPKMPQNDSSFLSAENIAQQEARRDAAPVVPPASAKLPAEDIHYVDVGVSGRVGGWSAAIAI